MYVYKDLYNLLSLRISREGKAIGAKFKVIFINYCCIFLLLSLSKMSSFHARKCVFCVFIFKVASAVSFLICQISSVRLKSVRQTVFKE